MRSHWTYGCIHSNVFSRYEVDYQGYLGSICMSPSNANFKILISEIDRIFETPINDNTRSTKNLSRGFLHQKIVECKTSTTFIHLFLHVVINA